MKHESDPIASVFSAGRDGIRDVEAGKYINPRPDPIDTPLKQEVAHIKWQEDESEFEE